MNLFWGDCFEVLRGMDADSVDAIVTDPPYGLAFMGKRWDYDVPTTEVWAECLRVLKPGGHLLAFAGTRTQHRMAVRIEDAGFEIRDMIAWVYGSGFPKSLDVSKAIDRMDAADDQARRRLRFTAWVRSTGATARQIDEATGTNMGGHYTTHRSQPAIMTRAHLEACRAFLGDVPAWVERECDIRTIQSRNMAGREVLGRHPCPAGNKAGGNSLNMSAVGMPSTADITAPATPAAQQWDGWGTALKPAMEPITVARKPLCGTVAENVLKHCTGGINVDGCRVGTDGGTAKGNPPKDESNGIHGHGINGACDILDIGKGRWPANVIHDGSDEVVGLFPQSKSTGGQASLGAFRNGDVYGKGRDERESRDPGFGDSGSAARFFYCAKASKADRDEGCEGLPVVQVKMNNGNDADGDPVSDRFTKMARNTHPTVKPTALMRYLCRLVTPPNGIVLDPFMGSGSTGKAAILEGFGFVGIEREPEYLEIARRRIEAVMP